MNNAEIKTLEDILLYLKIHNNRALYEKLVPIIDKIKLQRQKDNARKLKYITEKRKIDKNYGRENERKRGN